MKSAFLSHEIEDTAVPFPYPNICTIEKVTRYQLIFFFACFLNPKCKVRRHEIVDSI